MNPRASRRLYSAILRLGVGPPLWGFLRAHYPRDETEAAYERTWELFRELEPSILDEKPFGARLILRAAAGTLAFYQALRERGESDEGATGLLAEFTWVVYEKMGRVPWLLVGFRTRDPYRRLELATRFFRRFPFASPAYEWRDVEAPPGVVAFDCLRCPVAEFFSTHDAGTLCVETFCNLDFPLAPRWGASLSRTGSIAGGAPRCDFRWRVVDDVEHAGAPGEAGPSRRGPSEDS